MCVISQRTEGKSGIRVEVDQSQFPFSQKCGRTSLPAIRPRLHASYVKVSTKYCGTTGTWAARFTKTRTSWGFTIGTSRLVRISRASIRGENHVRINTVYDSTTFRCKMGGMTYQQTNLIGPSCKTFPSFKHARG